MVRWPSRRAGMSPSRTHRTTLAGETSNSIAASFGVKYLVAIFGSLRLFIQTVFCASLDIGAVDVSGYRRCYLCSLGCGWFGELVSRGKVLFPESKWVFPFVFPFQKSVSITI